MGRGFSSVDMCQIPDFLGFTFPLFMLMVLGCFAVFPDYGCPLLSIYSWPVVGKLQCCDSLWSYNSLHFPFFSFPLLSICQRMFPPSLCPFSSPEATCCKVLPFYVAAGAFTWCLHLVPAPSGHQNFEPLVPILVLQTRFQYFQI